MSLLDPKLKEIGINYLFRFSAGLTYSPEIEAVIGGGIERPMGYELLQDTALRAAKEWTPKAAGYPNWPL